ncbi:MAG: molybdate ABC transporter ATP-binding protein ModF [Pseudomonadales bacterium]|nr:molybdate ABC transporter ATP-binding protein ModF [Pseudomonadales bacterium]
MIEFDHCTIQLSESFSLSDITWQILPEQCWAIIGPNGSGKSALIAALTGEGVIRSGCLTGMPGNPGIVSLEEQARLIQRERDRDESDITDEVFEGTPVIEILNETCADQPLLTRLIQQFEFEPKLQRGFRKLSTGESRKVMLMRALTRHADMLILDDPFEGLDVRSVALVRALLDDMAGRVPVLMVLNRFDEIPPFVTHIACMNHGELVSGTDVSDESAMAELARLLHIKTTDIQVPDADPSDRIPALNPEEPLVRITDGRIQYGDTVVFEGLNWCVEAGQHWQVSGPNGSGKTCLLNLVTGDNPQCYRNDIFVFGYQRGNGESIWDIKQHIGYVSSALQWEYRVSISVINVIVSGFYDSIGLYSKASDVQLKIARQWLAVLGMSARENEPFQKLSFGDQRLLLIARAMVKHPHLLILDEPCIGLDDINRWLVLALVEKICADTQTTVIYVNHHAEDRIEGIHHHLELKGQTLVT